MRKYIDKLYGIFFFRTNRPMSNKLGVKLPWVKGIQICSDKGPCLFPRGNNSEMAKIHWQNLIIFFSRTTGSISIKLSTKHLRVKEIQIYSNEGPRPLPRRYNNEIANTHWRNVKIFFCWTIGSISTKLSIKLPRVKGALQIRTI